MEKLIGLFGLKASVVRTDRPELAPQIFMRPAREWVAMGVEENEIDNDKNES